MSKGYPWIFVLLFVTVGGIGCAAQRVSKRVPFRQPNLAASGIPCKEYRSLPTGWVCDEKREILLCADGWRPDGIDRCVTATQNLRTIEKFRGAHDAS